MPSGQALAVEFNAGGLRYNTTGIPNGQAEVIGRAPDNSATTIVIPVTAMDGTRSYNITRIGNQAFKGNGLTSATFADDSKVTYIGGQAFLENNLSTVDIPDSVTEIKGYAFAQNKIAGEVTIPSGVTIIDEGIFHINKLTSVIIPPGVTSIQRAAFAGNDLTRVTIPAGVTSIGDIAFYQNALSSVTIPANVTSIGDGAFYQNALKEVDIPASVTAIGGLAFQDNVLESVAFLGNFGAFELTMFEDNSSLTRITYDCELPAADWPQTFTTGPSSTVTSTAATPCAPAAPTDLEVTDRDQGALIKFTAAEPNGSPITDYLYSLDGGPDNSLGVVNEFTITGLTNDRIYSVTLKAVNEKGTSPPSTPAKVKPTLEGATAPAAPTNLSATAGDAQATIAFIAGADNGSDIEYYQYSLNDVDYTDLALPNDVSPVTIPGLANGTAYSIRLKAVNNVGASDASDPVAVTLPALPPAAPTDLSATAGDGQAVIAFTAGAPNGEPITNYQYRTNTDVAYTALNPADAASPITIPGLTNGTAYVITLKAVNSMGASTDDSELVSVTPAAVPPTATSVPLAPLWVLGVMAGLLSLVGVRKLRDV